MFVASFEQVSLDKSGNSKFKPNQHGQLPYIGDVVSGTALATIIDATIFEKKHSEGVLYLCENGVREYKGKEYPTVKIICAVTALEFLTFRKDLGAGITLIAKKIASSEPVETFTQAPVVEIPPVGAELPVTGAELPVTDAVDGIPF